MSSGEFLFVNSSASAGDASSPGGSKRITKSARAFLMRKARADQNWSTKSTKALDRRRAVFHQAGRPKQQQEDQSGTDGSAGRQSFAEFPASGGLHQQDPSRGSLSPKSRHAQQPAQQDRRASGRQPLRSDDYGIESSSSDEGGRHWVCWRCSRVVASTAAGNAGLCNVCNSGRDTASSAIVRRRSGGPSLPALRGKTDPFGSAVLPLEGDTAVLMTYFLSAIQPQLTLATGTIPSAKIDRGWIEPSLSHRAFMHAMLSLAALHLGMVACPANSERYIRLAIKHKVWAIRTIRDNLSDPREATSDENIAAVFNLLCVEENMFRSKFAAVDKLRCVEPDHDQRLKHLHGLRDMVRMRGGVLGLWDSNTPQSKTLPSFLIRHTTVQLITSFDRAHLLPPGLLNTLYQYPLSSRYYVEESKMAEACKEAGMDSELVELIRTSDCLLRDTDWFRSTRGNSSDLVDSHSDTSPDSSSSTISSDHRSFLMDALDVQNLYSLVIGALMEWHLSHSEDAGDSAASPVEHVVALCTAMVLIYAALGQHASLGPLPKGTLRLRRYLNSRTRTSLGRAGTSATAHLPTPPSSVTSPTPSHTLLTAGSSGIAVHDVSLALRPPPRSCPYPDQRSPSLSRRTASPSTPQHHDTDGNPQRLPIFTALSDIGLDVWAAVVVSMAAAGQPDEASYFRPALAATLAASLPESLHKSRDGWLALRAKLRNGDVIWGPEPLDAYAKQLWWAVMEEGGGGCEGPGGLNTGRHSDGKTTDDETMNPRQPQVAQQQTAIRSPTTQLVPLNPYTSACLVGLSNNRAVNLLK